MPPSVLSHSLAVPAQGGRRPFEDEGGTPSPAGCQEAASSAGNCRLDHAGGRRYRAGYPGGDPVAGRARAYVRLAGRALGALHELLTLFATRVQSQGPASLGQCGAARPLPCAAGRLSYPPPVPRLSGFHYWLHHRQRREPGRRGEDGSELPLHLEHQSVRDDVSVGCSAYLATVQCAARPHAPALRGQRGPRVQPQ